MTSLSHDQLGRANRPVAQLSAEDCSIDDLRRLVEAVPGDAELAEQLQFADQVSQGVPVFQASALRSVTSSSDLDTIRELLAELHWTLAEGPGIYVISGAFAADVVDGASAEFEAIIAGEKQGREHSGDHFAAAGANDRVWNALEKLALQAPQVFVDYYRNDMVALGANSWLGPGYLVTSQVNVVNPGGSAQQPHRDYHLGFMAAERAEQYPLTAHLLSPGLTLQGAIAHCDMPLETGPTTYLPHTQKYKLGYLAWRQEPFIDYFADHHVQLPLSKGDLVYFNPALFHAAGANITGGDGHPAVRRMANLLQVSSAFGRPMESIDHLKVAEAVYPALRAAAAAGVERAELSHAAAAATDGYAFPTNLDRDPPVGGLTPPSQYDIVMAALDADVDDEELQRRLEAHAQRRST